MFGSRRGRAVAGDEVEDWEKLLQHIVALGETTTVGKWDPSS
jgi:hypothetical protein